MSNERKLDRKSHPLPEGWVWTKLGEIVSFKYGSGLPKNKREKGIVPVYGSNGLIGYHSQSLVDGPCLIIGRKGAIGRIHLSEKPCWPIDTTYFIKPPFELFIKYLFYFLKILNLSNLDKSTAIPGLNRNDAYRLTIPLPPFPEQHRIVAKIEELFMKLNAGVEALKKIKTQIKRYRQAVLKHAFEGKLTADWRQRMLNDELRIVNEKDDLSRFKIDNTDLTDLPRGWLWIKFENILEKVEKVNPKSEPNKQFIYLDIASIDNSLKKVTSPKKYFGIKAPSRARQLVKSGDILFSTVRTYLKNIAFVDEKYNNQIASTGFCVIRPKERINKKYIFYLVQSDSFLNPLNDKQRGTSYPAVRNSDVFSQIIPISKKNEQDKIVEEIERRLSIADEIEKIVEQSLKQADRLRQSTLKRAFEGKLVPSTCLPSGRDPYDIPPAEDGKYFVYIFKCEDGSLYKGFTQDLKKRWIEHVTRKGADWTKYHMPIYLFHWENVDSMEEAVEREKYFKSGIGREWLKKQEKTGNLQQVFEPADILLEKIKAEKARHLDDNRIIKTRR